MATRALKLLSYNIQMGIPTHSLTNYILGSWRHVMPFPGRNENLRKIAASLSDYDIVGLQEVDSYFQLIQRTNDFSDAQMSTSLSAAFFDVPDFCLIFAP